MKPEKRPTITVGESIALVLLALIPAVILTYGIVAIMRDLGLAP